MNTFGGFQLIQLIAELFPRPLSLEGELSKPSDKFVGGKSTMNLGIYTGPGTPPNTDWHHYTWTLIATDLDPKALQPGMTREELAAALKDHVKGSAGLVTRFRHPT